MIFLIAVFVFKEPFGTTQMTAFSLIWAGLVLYSWSMLRQSRAR
jgi:chloramphenicol-sensitive protein RarD